VLGVTATPDRADRVSLGEVFDEVAYEYHVRQAIADGWLCPIRSYLVQTRVDFSGVRKVAGELATGEVERILTDEPHLAEIATPILRERGERPAIVFAASVAHAHALRRVLNQLAGRGDFAAALDGRATLERRAPVIERFRRGELKVLVNCSLFTEGFDVPQIALVAIARPVLSRPFYAQMVGRGTRIAPGKRDLLVLDFVPANCRHSLVHAVDLVAEGDDELAELAREVASKRSAQGGSIGLEEALELARQEREARAADVSYQLRRRNPFAAVGIDLERFARRSRSAAARKDVVQLASPELLAFFRKAGLPTEQVAALTAEEAFRLREELLDRRAVGLCTPRQAQELQAFGIDAVDMYYEEARERLRELKPKRRRAGGTRRPVADS
jgi:superfamily II DNA or RNA helicase